MPEHLSVEKQHEKNSFRSNSQKRTREAVCAFLPSQNLSFHWWIPPDQNFVDFMYILEILEISCIATAGGLAYRQRILDLSLLLKTFPVKCRLFMIFMIYEEENSCKVFFRCVKRKFV